MIAGIGLDIIEIARFDKPDNPHFNERCFTAHEYAYISSKGLRAQAEAKAGMFAAKEAVVKALGTGFRGFWPCEVEILHDALGKPFAVLHGKPLHLAKQRYITRVTISITHHQSTAAAMAVAEQTEGANRYARRYRGTNARHRISRRP